jgi:hypothetical protein
MTNPGDDQPLAPRRSLNNPIGPGPSPARPQPVTAPTYGGAPQHAPVAPPVERTLAGAGVRHGPEASGPPSDYSQQQPQDVRSDQKSSRPAPRTRTTRRAKLRLLRVDPWSVTKVSFLLSIAFGIMCVVAVFLLFSIMDAAGLWDSVNATIQGVLNQSPDEAFDVNDYVRMDRVMAITMLIAAIDVVLITALATLGAFIYNMAASLLGGVEVTLAEDLK